MKTILIACLIFISTFTLKAQSSCNNEDFEATSAGTIIASSQITGWTVNSGTNVAAGASCTLAAFASQPNAVTVINTPYTDPNIGPTYPIFSVFGSTPNGGGMFGSTIVKLNDAVPNYGAHRISKTINVTSNNDLFQFAYITMSAGGHGCCDGPMSRFQLKDASNTLLPCPKILDNYPASGCPGVASFSVCPANGGMQYHKWKISAFDLSAYIGSTVTFEAIVSDCIAGSHPGYMYFDAQCGALGLTVNSIFFAYSGPSFISPTCGSGSTATLTAPAGLGPYSWTGPVGFVPTSAQTATTNITGNYTLTMTPPGSCVPTIWTSSLVISPAVNLIASTSSNPLCLGNSATLTANASSGIPPYTYSWSTGATSSVIAVSPTTSVTYTTYVTDNVGCINSNTVTQNVTSCTGINSLSGNTKNSIIFPNPNNGDFTLKMEGVANSSELIIENALGQIVHSQTISQGENKIRTKNLAQGIYYYVVLENKQVVSKGKMKIE